MDTLPPVLCGVARRWHELSMLELVDLFRTIFAPAYALLDAAVAEAARDYAEFSDAAVPVMLVCQNLH